MSAALYQHPDGHEITVGQGLITACTAEGVALLELGTTVAQDESERAGAALGADLSRELFALRGRPQAETFRAVNEALRALTKLEHPDSAAGGFAAAIVNVLELGIANLPKFDGEE